MMINLYYQAFNYTCLSSYQLQKRSDRYHMIFIWLRAFNHILHLMHRGVSDKTWKTECRARISLKYTELSRDSDKETYFITKEDVRYSFKYQIIWRKNRNLFLDNSEDFFVECFFGHIEEKTMRGKVIQLNKMQTFSTGSSLVIDC